MSFILNYGTILVDLGRDEMENSYGIAIRNMIANQDKADEIVCRMVYEFAKNLPYSMDYMDEKFVPGDFINFKPENPKKFLFVDYGCVYNKMIHWGDTIVNGVKLQVCNIFQKMLMTESVDRYQLEEIDFYTYGFDNLTGMDIYNRNVFNLLVDLPKYCALVRNATSKEERRKALEEVYNVIDKVTSYVEYTKKTNKVITEGVETIDEEVIRFVRGWSPAQDLNMLYTFSYIDIWNLDVRAIIDACRPKLESGRPLLHE